MAPVNASQFAFGMMPRLFLAFPLRGCLRQKHLNHPKCVAHRMETSVYKCAHYAALAGCHLYPVPLMPARMDATATAGYYRLGTSLLDLSGQTKRGNPRRLVLLSSTETISTIWSERFECAMDAPWHRRWLAQLAERTSTVRKRKD